jgi:hypothetical protein
LILDEGAVMSDGTVLSWAEVQMLALPPDATMLVPPPVESAEVVAPAGGPPVQHRDWLDDAFAAAPAPVAVDPAAAQAAAERAEYGPGPVRFLANLITFNALLERAQTPAKAGDDEHRPAKTEPPPARP